MYINNKKRNIKRIAGTLIVLYLLLYTLGPAILSDTSASLTFAKMSLILLMTVVFVINYGRKDLGVMNFVVSGLLLFVFIQFLVFRNYEVFKVVGINVFVYYIFARYCNKDYIPFFSEGLKFCTLLVVLSVLWLCIESGTLEYDRGGALIDKSFITGLLGLSYIYIVVDIFYHKRLFVNICLLLLFVFVNLMIIQSKISVAVLLICILFLYLVSEDRIRKEMQKYFFCILALGVVFVIILPNKLNLLGDDIKYAVNILTGNNIFDDFIRSEERMDMTYNIRHDLWEYCIHQLFMENILLGIGVGNAGMYISRIYDWLSETESSLLSIITEGGIVYAVLMFSFFYINIRQSYIALKKEQTQEYYYPLLIFIAYVIMIIGNDFLDSLFWIQTGAMTGVILHSKR